MSKTDHARKQGSHQYLTRTDRRLTIQAHQFPTWESVFNGNRRPAILAVTEVNEVTMTPEVIPPTLCKFCRAVLDVAEWERELLVDSGEAEVLDYCDYACLEDATNFKDMGLEWAVSDDTLDMAERFRTVSMGRDRFLDEDEAGWEFHDEAWLPLVTIEEAREIFGGGDFIIDHTNVVRTKKTRWEL